MIIDQESQRNLTNFTQVLQVIELLESTALFNNKRGYYAGNHFKPIHTKSTLICEYFHLKGHTKKTATSWLDIHQTSSLKEEDVLLVILDPMQIRLVG